jgi:hypothetical protein
VESLDESLGLLQDMGLSLSTPAYLIGLLLFGIAGIVLWVLGRRRRNPAVKYIGLALMLYPYLVWGTVALYGAGTVLSAAAVWCLRRDSSQRPVRR